MMYLKTCDKKFVGSLGIFLFGLFSIIFVMCYSANAQKLPALKDLDLPCDTAHRSYYFSCTTPIQIYVAQCESGKFLFIHNEKWRRVDIDYFTGEIMGDNTDSGAILARSFNPQTNDEQWYKIFIKDGEIDTTKKYFYRE